MQQKIQNYLLMAKQHLLLTGSVQMRQLSGWPILPWLILVAIVLALLFLPLSCAKPTPQIDVQEISQTVPGHLGEFKLLANSQPAGSSLLGAFQLSSGRVLLVYTNGTWAHFDPDTNAFTEATAIEAQIGGKLLLLDDTHVLATGGAQAGHYIINTATGETTNFGSELSTIQSIWPISDTKLLAFGYRQQFGNQGVSQLVYDWQTGAEVITDNPSNYQPWLSVGGPAYAASYDLGEDVLIARSGIGVLHKDTLTFELISDRIGKIGDIYPLANGLIMLVPDRYTFDNDLYIYNPDNRQIAVAKLGYGLGLRDRYLATFTDGTEETMRQLIREYNRNRFVSVLNDGTVLFTRNDVRDIAKDPVFWAVNEYQVVADVNPPAEQVELRNPLLEGGTASFEGHLVLDDGRVLFLGPQNVIYIPDTQRTDEQVAISARQASLPDWPGTNFSSAGVWRQIGQLVNMDELDIREHTDTLDFFGSRLKGVAQVDARQLLFFFQRGINLDFVGQLFNLATHRASIIEASDANRAKYDPIIDSQAENVVRHVVETRLGQFRIGGPDAPKLLSDSELKSPLLSQAEKDAANGVADIERWNDRTQTWVSFNQEALDKRKAQLERQGKDVQVYDSRAMSPDKLTAFQEMIDKAQSKTPNLVYLDKDDFGARLQVVRDGSFSATALPDGKILVIGGIADLSHLPWAEALPDGRVKVNWVIGTINPCLNVFSANPCVLSPTLGNQTGTKRGSTRSIEIYDPKTETSQEIGELVLGRVGHKVILLPDHKVAIIGGGTQKLGVKDAPRGDQVGGESYFYADGVLAAQSSYEIFDLTTGTSKLYENVLMFPHDNQFIAEVMPNGHIYIESEDYAEVLDWHNHISYPTTTTHGAYSMEGSTGLGDGEVVVATPDLALSDYGVFAYAPVSGGPRLLPRAINWSGEDPLDMAVLRYFLWTQLTILLLGMPLIYLIVGTTRRSQIRQRGRTRGLNK